MGDLPWIHLQRARWAMNPCRLRDSIDMAIYSHFGTTEVPRRVVGPGTDPVAAERERIVGIVEAMPAAVGNGVPIEPFIHRSDLLAAIQKGGDHDA